MDGSYSTHEYNQKLVLSVNKLGVDHVGNILVDGKITLCWISEGTECKNVNLNLLTMTSEAG
jgi:hypothetical protein